MKTVIYKNNEKQSLLSGAVVLMFSTVLVHVIGLIYKIPITALVGEVGRGYFTSAYELYTPIYAISMAGLPIAVSKMVSERIALGKYDEVVALFKTAQKVFFITGVVGTLILLLFAYPLTKYVIKTSEAFYSVIAIAPSIFFCCLISSYRGYYEGLSNMVPTGISQIIETLGKLVFGIFLSSQLLKYSINEFNSSGIVFGVKCNNLNDVYLRVAPFSSAAAIFGVTLGSLIALIYLVIRKRLKGDNLPKSQSSKKYSLTKSLINTAIPIAMSSLVLNITNLIDSLTIQGRLNSAILDNCDIIKNIYPEIAKNNIDDGMIKSFLYGCYGVGLDFRNVIPTVIMTLGVSAIPVLSSNYAKKDIKGINSSIETVLKVGIVISVFFGLILAIFSKEILSILYSGTNSASTVTIAAPIVRMFGLFSIIFSLSAPTTNMLQAIGCSNIPLRSLGIGAIIKIICNFVLVGIPSININGAPIGSVLCSIFMLSYNMYFLIKKTGVKINIKSTFFTPLLISSISASYAYLFYKIQYTVYFNKIYDIFSLSKIQQMTISCLLSIIFSMIIWLLLLFTFNFFSEIEKKYLFIGKKPHKRVENQTLME